MRLANVIGRITLSKKDKALIGARLIIVSPLVKESFLKSTDELLHKSVNLVCYDSLGAGIGDVIGFVEGAEATAPFESPIPIDAYNVAIMEKFNYNPKA